MSPTVITDRDEPTEQVVHQIGVECHRALRRLDALIRDRDDVLLRHARDFVQHAAALSEALERDGRGAAPRDHQPALAA